MTIEEVWMYENRHDLKNRYRAGTFVAVYDWAVIEWGDDAGAVRQRAEARIGDAGVCWARFFRSARRSNRDDADGLERAYGEVSRVSRTMRGGW
jgi:hypothetical protein